MDFQTAFDKAFEVNKKAAKEKGQDFVVSPRTARTLAFMWNMLKASNFVLDDFAMISDTNDIVSIPDDKPQSPKKDKKAKDSDETVNGDDGEKQ